MKYKKGDKIKFIGKRDVNSPFKGLDDSIENKEVEKEGVVEYEREDGLITVCTQYDELKRPVMLETIDKRQINQ